VLGQLGHFDERRQVLETNLALLEGELQRLKREYLSGQLPADLRWQRRRLYHRLAEVSWQLGHHEKANGYAQQFLADGRREIEQGFVTFFSLTQAWFLVTWSDECLRNPDEAIDLVQQALKQSNLNAGEKTIAARVLTVAHLRKSNWNECIATADKTVPIEGFAAAIAHWQQGEHTEANACYERSATQMDKEFEDFFDLRFGTEQLRAEAEELLGISTESGKTQFSATEAEK
jgi:tetratricopeptide (TPR) repeat protein